MQLWSFTVMLDNERGEHANANICFLCATAEYIFQDTKLKHLFPPSTKKKLQAPAIWKPSSQISNFTKCSINCAVLILRQQLSLAHGSRIHKAINHSVNISYQSQDQANVKLINHEAA